MRRPLLLFSLFFMGLILCHNLCFSHFHKHTFCSNYSAQYDTLVYKQDTKYLYLKVKQENNLRVRLSLSSLFGEDTLTYPALAGYSLSIYGTLREFNHATNPGEFDAYSYYHTQNLCGELKDASLKSISIKASCFSILSRSLYRYRQFLEGRLFQRFSKENAGILSDMLLGDRGAIDSDIQELYRQNGIAHILSISGLHISILGMGLYAALRRFTTPRVCGCVCSLFMLLYWIFTGCSISASRACFVFVLEMLSHLFGRTRDIATSLGMTAILILAFHPGELAGASFLLSFGSICGILWVYPALQSSLSQIYVPRRIYHDPTPWVRLKTILEKAAGIIGRSLFFSFCISYTTLPITLSFYYEIAILSPVLNLLILPLMTPLLLSGMLALLSPWPILSTGLASLILKWISFLCKIASSSPIRHWNPGKPTSLMCVLFYLFLFLCLGLSYRKYLLRALLRKKIVLSFLMLSNRQAGLLTLGIMLVSFLIFTPSRLQPGSVTFLDVGQGDCILLYTEGKELYLFDGGSTSRSNVGRYVIKPFLKVNGLHNIDCIFLSHKDADHGNGILELAEQALDWDICIKKIGLSALCQEEVAACVSLYQKEANDSGSLYQKQTDSSASLYQNDLLYQLTYAAQDNQLPIVLLSAPTTWKSGGTTLTCLHPASDFQADSENAASMCFLITFSNNRTLLLTGDVEAGGEEELTHQLEKTLLQQAISHVDILKVAHHGSAYSSSDDFLQAASPSLSIISAGKNNRYGHPHTKTLDRLRQKNSAIMSTQDYGAISISMTGKTILIMPYVK